MKNIKKYKKPKELEIKCSCNKIEKARLEERERIVKLVVEEFDELLLSFHSDEKGQKVLKTHASILEEIKK